MDTEKGGQGIGGWDKVFKTAKTEIDRKIRF